MPLSATDPASPSGGAVPAGECLALAHEVFAIEAAAIQGLTTLLDERFAAVVNAILKTKGRVIVCGIGKSGIIGKKISATLASTGTPSFFMHPAEAFHGDLGMVVPEDIFVAISYSGETAELIRLLPFLRSNANETLAITGNPRSTIAVNATYHLCVRVDKEACPLQLAPTASTTATLAMGDAIAVVLMKARGFESHHFARFHPGGSLGRLLSRVRDEMVTRNLPFILPDASANEVITAVTGGKLGVALVSDEHRHLLGIITDGDLRRALVANKEQFFTLTAARMMTAKPHTVGVDAPMGAAVELMAQHRITSLVVLDGETVVGVVQK